MKKLFYLLFLLPLAFFASCSDDDDLAQVDFSVTLSGVSQVDSKFYTVVGDTVSVDGVSVKSLTDKAATVTGVRYHLDGYPIWASIEEAKFNFSFTTKDMKPGTHTFTVTSTVLQVDKSITSAVVNIPLVVVEDEEKLPEGAPEIGTFTTTVRLSSK